MRYWIFGDLSFSEWVGYLLCRFGAALYVRQMSSGGALCVRNLDGQTLRITIERDEGCC